MISVCHSHTTDTSKHQDSTPKHTPSYQKQQQQGSGGAPSSLEQVFAAFATFGIHTTPTSKSSSSSSSNGTTTTPVFHTTASNPARPVSAKKGGGGGTPGGAAGVEMDGFR